MNLKAKTYLERQKELANERLAARMAFLKEKGLDGAVINRDVSIRKIKAEIRKANYRLACIAAQVKLNENKVQAKAEKSTAKQSAEKAPPAKKAKGEPGKKERKEKKRAPSPEED